MGQDLDLLIYDAHSGFDPDGFGAATGAIRGGGLLILLTPPLADWPQCTDPEAARIAVWPHSARSTSGRFLARLVTLLLADQQILRLQQREVPPTEPELRPHRQAERHPPLPVSTESPPAAPRASRALTPDQQRACEAILQTARGRARRPLVLIAHRGRGKSAALGLAAGQLLATSDCRILVTAPRRAAVAPVFHHAEAVLADTESARQAPSSESGLTYSSPQAILETWPEADLLLVDEAAGIPAPLLEAMLAHYRRIVFSTTVHGYEGTGRGFEVRFRATLDRLTPSWRALRLERPIRWAPADPLEALTFRALLLDATPAPAQQLATADPANCRCERLDPARLIRDEQSLHELFGLLVLAHYQTRPLDLRVLLDGPNVRLYVLRHAGRIAATLLAAEEGGIQDAELREAIFAGRRRPRGHLLPQTLSAHAGLLDAPSYRYMRVMRLAVHPSLTGRGLGRMLLRALLRAGRAEGFDLAGASLGATPGLLRFWDRCGYRPVQIGTRRNAASGEHAVVVLRRLSRPGSGLVATARCRLQSRLPILLAGPLRRLDPAIAVGLIRSLPPSAASRPTTQPPGAPTDWLELRGFVAGHRTLEASLPPLAALVRDRLGPCLRAGAIRPDEAALLVAAAAQLRPLTELVPFFGARGRDELLQGLRLAAGRVLPET